jgi:hypothetical protein
LIEALKACRDILSADHHLGGGAIVAPPVSNEDFSLERYLQRYFEGFSAQSWASIDAGKR